MVQDIQVLERKQETPKAKISPLLPLIQQPKPAIYLNGNGIDPPHDWLDDPLIALELPRGPYTFDNADEFLEREAVELYNGWLVRQEMSTFYTKELEGNFYENLSGAVRSLGYGRVLPDQMECLMANGNTIKPDLNMISWERRRQNVMPKGPNDRPTLLGSPEFVVEVRSPSNWRKQEALKRKMYFDNGAEIIWNVDEDNQIIYVYRVDSQEEPETYTIDDEIHCEPLLPGWRRHVADLFAEETPMEVMYSEVVDTFREEGEKIGEQRGRKEGEKIGEKRGREEGEKLGREEGEKIGEQRGREEGELRGKQDMLTLLVKSRFPHLPESDLEIIKGTTDMAQLDSWVNPILVAQMPNELPFSDQFTDTDPQNSDIVPNHTQ